ncbi:MAG TPA: hypothetical protein VJ723_03265, partial [Candidatus Angelobacter sp.]|nr:hypothetical protein [Candidatus Angelobacter sp.]
MKLVDVLVTRQARLADAADCLGRGEFGRCAFPNWLDQFVVGFLSWQLAIQQGYQTRALAVRFRGWRKQTVAVLTMALLGLISGSVSALAQQP